MSGKPAGSVAAPFGAGSQRTTDAPPRFCRVRGEHFQFAVDQIGTAFDVDGLRRERQELIGEVTVRCALPGALTVDGVLLVASFNFSRLSAREVHARYLESRARTHDVDWVGLLEEFAQRVLSAERTGQPAVQLRDLPRSTLDHSLEVDGLTLLMRHPVIVFGDGGVAKSYLSLYVAGRLEQAYGVRVGLFDWELAADDHRDRLERLFGADLPGTYYARCDRPFVQEIDRLRRIVSENGLDYVIFDSIAFACDGPPEAAEVTARYFHAVRQLGLIGSLHVAHISRAEKADQKPFGSTFWHNGARATWNVKSAGSVSGSDRMTVALYNRKTNLGAIRPAVGFEISFTADRTTVRPVAVADTPDLASHLPVRERMAEVLRVGAMSPAAVAEEIQADLETVKRTARRHRELFRTHPGGKLGLVERQR